MARFPIYHKGATIATAAPSFTGTYLKPGVLTFREIASPHPIPWHIGDYVDYPRTGLRYSLYKIPQVKKQAKPGSHGASYLYQSVELHDASYELEICPFRDLVYGDNQVHFSTQSSISVFDDVAGIAERVQACLDAFRPGGWVVRLATAAMGASAELLALMAEEREFVVSGVTLLGVLEKVYEVWPEVGWVFSVENGMNTITIGGAGLNGLGDAYAYSKGHGLTSLTKTAADETQIANRLYVYGSQRNMLANWYNHQNIYGAESVDIQNLMLPAGPVSGDAVKFVYNGVIYTYSGKVYTHPSKVALYEGWGLTDNLPDPAKAYIEDAASILARGLREKSVYFDGSGDLKEIYPTIEKVTMAEVRASSPEYVPAASWADSERVDEVLSCTNPADDGFSGANGKNSLQRVGEDFANNISGTAPAHTESVRVIFEKNITATVSGELKLKADVKINGHLQIATGQYYALRIKILRYVGTYTEGAILAQTEQELEYDWDEYVYRVRGGVAETDKIPVTAGDVFIVKAELVFSISGDTGYQYNYSDDGYLDFIIGTYREKTFPLYLKQIGFNITDQAALGEGITLAMRSGDCAGREFKVKDAVYLQATDTWRLEVIRSEDESLAQWFPNNTYQIAAGDHFVLLDIAMPAMYIAIAEKRLLAAAQELLADTAREQWQYTPDIDAKFMVESGRTILPAHNITLEDDIVPSGAVSMLVDSVTITESDSEIPTYKVTLRNRKKKSYSDKASVTPISSRSVEEIKDDSSGSSSSSGSGSGGTGHTHANKDVLDKLGLSGLYLTVDGSKAQAGYADTAGDADHATNADYATDAGHADSADEATHATNADDALHADNADLATRALTADYALDSDKWDGEHFGDYLNQGVRTGDQPNFAGVTTPNVKSADFTPGPLGSGFRLYKPTGGNSALEIDEITVRKTMKVFELIIQQIQFQGGIVIYSAAAMECTKVVELETGYKCYFDTKEDENGNAQVPNLFAVGDQARCQRFQLASTVAKYYWRLVTEVGDDYIVLSKTDCDTGSGVPAAGDNIVQLGNRTQTSRMNAQVVTVSDANSPRTDYYKGINSYDLTGKLITTVGVKNGEVGVWTKNGSFEGVVTISGGSGLQNLDEWADVSASIVAAQTAADKALDLLSDINDDNILDLSEKASIRTEWITINGIASTSRGSTKGSYAATKAMFEQYAAQIGQTVFTNGSLAYTFNGVKYTYRNVGVAVLDSTYLALREFLASVSLNDRNNVFRGFDRAQFSELLTAYYDAEIKVNDAINKCLQNEIAITKSEILADLAAYESAINQTIEEMQSVIDNTIETWFAAGTPTLSNYPASDWNTDALKEQHIGDLYYDNGSGATAGFAFRFERTGSPGNYTYQWNVLQDSAFAVALAAANRAQDTADGKRRTFLAQPGTDDAYDAGDMWLHATLTNSSGTYTNETLVAQNHKDAGVAFVPNDWVRADKYTDDTVANAAAAAAANAQTTADNAALAAQNAQTKANNAYDIADAAKTRLDAWADDGYISPEEKSALKQQRADIEAEKVQICADAALYPTVSDTAYVTAYNAICGTNGVFDKYTASTPENIPVVASELDLIDDYYTERTNILNAIAAAAKAKADAAQQTANYAKNAADTALQAIADINDDTVLDISEKCSVRTLWIGINGIVSTSSMGTTGTYYAAKRMLEEYTGYRVPVKYVFNGVVYTFNGVSYIYNRVGGAALDSAYLALREYLAECGLNNNESYEGFDREKYSNLVRDYDVALNYVQKTLTDVAKGIAEDATGQLEEWGADGAISPMEKRGLLQILNDLKAEYATLTEKASKYGIGSSVTEYAEYVAAFKRLYDDTTSPVSGVLVKYTANLTTTSARDADYEYIALYYPKRDALAEKVDAAEKSLIDAKAAASDVDYLTTALAKDNTVITGGVVLSSFIGVKDSQSNVRAAINASGSVAGFSDATHGKLMIAAGISTLAQAKDSAKFRVFEDGHIVAESGVIGGFTISSDELCAGNGSTYIELCADSTQDHFILAGGTSISNAPFYVKKSGEIKATSGTIGGWTLGTNKLSSGSSTGYVAFDSNASNTYAIWAGNTTASAAPFSVTRAGAIKATSGSIGGFAITADSIGTTSTAYGSGATGIQHGRIFIQNSNSASGQRWIELNAAGGSSKIRIYSDYSIDTGLYIGGKMDTAIWADKGVFAGLRPQYRYLDNSWFPYTLRWDDFNLFIHNTQEVTLTLPSSPDKGQTAHIIKMGGGLLKINCNGNSVWLNGGNKSGTFGLTSYNAFIVLFFYGSSNCVMSLHVED